MPFVPGSNGELERVAHVSNAGWQSKACVSLRFWVFLNSQLSQSVNSYVSILSPLHQSTVVSTKHLLHETTIQELNLQRSVPYVAVLDSSGVWRRKGSGCSIQICPVKTHHSSHHFSCWDKLG